VSSEQKEAEQRGFEMLEDNPRERDLETSASEPSGRTEVFRASDITVL
jgi:hypothetical protein